MVPVRIFAPFAFGYFLSYVYRAVNAVAGPGVSADLGIEPAALGLLTSVYFLAFAAVQLPLGVLLDRYPAHKVEALLLLVAAAGSMVFALGTDLATLTFGRALIGFGVSACLMAAFKAYASLVPLEKLPLVNGLHLAVGGLGLLSSGLPSELAIGIVGWRGLFVGLALLSLAEAAALWLLGRTPQSPSDGSGLLAQFRDVGRILSSRPFLAIAPAATAAQMTSLSIQSLWAGPWLREVAGFSAGDAALILSAMAAAATVGFVAAGSVGNLLARRGVPVEYGSATGIALFLSTQPVILLAPVPVAVAAWVAFAFLSSASMLTFPALTALFPRGLSGRVNTALNFVVFVAAFLAQWATGLVVQATTPSLGDDGAFALAFGLLAGLQALALAWFVLCRRTVRGDPCRGGSGV